MNKELRLEILINSLELENQLSKIIARIIRVPKSGTKTLGNQSSSLSFKTKVDLLYDLDRISKSEYNLIILFIEIRNQFIHNLESDSFVKVCEILGNNKRNKLVSIDSRVAKLYSDYESHPEAKIDIEGILKLAFGALDQKLRKILINQYERLLHEIQKDDEDKARLEQHDVFKDMTRIVLETVEEFGNIYADALKKDGIKTEFPKLLNSFVWTKSIKKLTEKYPDLMDGFNSNK